MQNQAVGYGINYIKENPKQAANFAAKNASAIGNFAMAILKDGIVQGGASAVLAASIFHFGEYSISEAKEYLKKENVPVRL